MSAVGGVSGIGISGSGGGATGVSAIALSLKVRASHNAPL